MKKLGILAVFLLTGMFLFSSSSCTQVFAGKPMLSQYVYLYRKENKAVKVPRLSEEQLSRLDRGSKNVYEEALLNSKYALEYMGDLFYRGRHGLTKDQDGAILWYTAAAVQGHSSSAVKKLCKIYAGRQDYEKAFDALQVLINCNNLTTDENIECLIALGDYECGGFGCKKDYFTANSYYMTAFDVIRAAGSKESYMNRILLRVGFCYLNLRESNNDSNARSAVDVFRAVISSENCDIEHNTALYAAYYLLGRCYNEGTGVAADSEKAKYNLKQALQYGSEIANYVKTLEDTDLEKILFREMTAFAKNVLG